MTMQSSLTVFLAATAFIAFGYLSLVRLMSKQEFEPQSLRQWSAKTFNGQLLSNLGSSALFVSLPATSLLLFWGWGPALIWLAVFHVIIETVAQLRVSTPNNSHGIADYLLRNDRTWLASLEQGLIQFFFLLSMGVVTALLATLIDRQSGLLFALLFLFPARALLRNPRQTVPLWLKAAGALGLLALGIAVSNQLGFSIYGDWAPAGDWLPWLNFRNPTVIALVLVIAVFQMEKDLGFKGDLAKFAGGIILALLIAMLAFLLVSQPTLDAPLNASPAEDNPLPSFWGLHLLLFTGFSSLIIRLLNEEDNKMPRGVDQFSRLQLSGLIYCLILICLLMSLAGALGIGAWKSHYLNWGAELNILEHLNLAISSLLVLLGSQAESGSVLHTIVLTALCVTGFSFMMNCANQLSLEESEKDTLFSLILESKLPQAILVFASSCYLIEYGVGVDIWLLIGILAWVLSCHLGLGMSLAKHKSAWSADLWKYLSVVLILFGALQIIWLIINWIAREEFVFAICSSLILVLSTALWWQDLIKLLRDSGSANETELF